jgi:hypothetical protein
MVIKYHKFVLMFMFSVLDQNSVEGIDVFKGAKNITLINIRPSVRRRALHSDKTHGRAVVGWMRLHTFVKRTQRCKRDTAVSM